MGRFQPVLPMLKTNLTRRRGRTWHVLGLVVVIFLGLTFIAVRYLPTVVIDPVSVLKNREFKDIFAPPIPRPPGHDHSLHLAGDQSRLKEKINQHKDNIINLDDKPKGQSVKINENTQSANVSTYVKVLSVEELTEKFSHMSTDELQKIQSPQLRREKVREVSLNLFFLFFLVLILKEKKTF